MKKSKRIGLSFLCAIGAAIVAILVHALLPSPGATLDVTSFDSWLAQTLGFPVVASIYFVLLYLHILFVIRTFGAKAPIARSSIGWRYGIAFGLIYLIGMQEIVMDGSPFQTYGIDFVLYQLCMGLGDAIPVVLLCLFASKLMIHEQKERVSSAASSKREKILTIALIAAGFLIERIIGYTTGYIHSDFPTYPTAVVVWTLSFGIALGCAYCLIEPMTQSNRGVESSCKSVLFSIGLNWIWFNSFIGLILKGTIGQMLLRSGQDVFVLFIISIYLNYRKNKRNIGEK